jgi:hypothetical protein
MKQITLNYDPEALPSEKFVARIKSGSKVEHEVKASTLGSLLRKLDLDIAVGL